MDGVGWIAAIIIGGIAGWLATIFMKSDTGLFTNIILGIIGAAIASFLFGLLGVSFGGWLGYLVAGAIVGRWELLMLVAVMLVISMMSPVRTMARGPPRAASGLVCSRTVP